MRGEPAAELDIPRAYANWEQLLDADGVDTVHGRRPADSCSGIRYTAAR